MKPTVVTAASFEADVLKADRPVLVDFWAPWCRPCLAAKPIMEALATQYEALVTVATFNLDDDKKDAISKRYKVKSIPMFLVFLKGKVTATVVGVGAGLKGQLVVHLDAALFEAQEA